MAGKVSSKLYIRRMILAHSMGKRILKRQRMDKLDVHQTNLFFSHITLKGRHIKGEGGGGGVMKRKISREEIYRQLKSQGKRLKAMSISLGSVSVVEKSTVLSFLFNFVSDHTSPTPTLCPKWELSVNVALGKGQVDSFPETHYDPLFLLRLRITSSLTLLESS